VISETSKGIHLKLKIKGGSLTVWLSKKLIRIYEYDSEGGHTKEVEIPQWRNMGKFSYLSGHI